MNILLFFYIKIFEILLDKTKKKWYYIIVAKKTGICAVSSIG